jgi:hypothetical protein
MNLTTAVNGASSTISILRVIVYIYTLKGSLGSDAKVILNLTLLLSFVVESTINNN